MSDTHEQKDRKDRPGRAKVAVFASHEEARQAIEALHKAHYGRTWLGMTSLAETAKGDTAVTVEGGGFFSGTQSLVDALVKHGVRGEEARSVEQAIEPGSAVVTIDPKDKGVDEAMVIVREYGGRLTSDTTRFDDVSTFESGTDPLSARGYDEDQAFWGEETFYRTGVGR